MTRLASGDEPHETAPPLPLGRGGAVYDSRESSGSSSEGLRRLGSRRARRLGGRRRRWPALRAVVAPARPGRSPVAAWSPSRRSPWCGRSPRPAESGSWSRGSAACPSLRPVGPDHDQRLRAAAARARPRPHESRSITVIHCDGTASRSCFPAPAERSRSSAGAAPPAGTVGRTVYALTSLAHRVADPGRLTVWPRGHWRIDNRVHHVRDVTQREDASRIRPGRARRGQPGIRPRVAGLGRGGVDADEHRLAVDAAGGQHRLGAGVGVVLGKRAVQER